MHSVLSSCLERYITFIVNLFELSLQSLELTAVWLILQWMTYGLMIYFIQVLPYYSYLIKSVKKRERRRKRKRKRKIIILFDYCFTVEGISYHADSN